MKAMKLAGIAALAFVEVACAHEADADRQADNVTEAPEESPSGNRDKEIIRRIVRANMGGIQACWDAEVRRRGRAEDRELTFRWVVGADGVVEPNVQLTRVEPPAADVGMLRECVTKVIREARYPKPKGGGRVIINYPFKFRASS